MKNSDHWCSALCLCLLTVTTTLSLGGCPEGCCEYILNKQKTIPRSISSTVLFCVFSSIPELSNVLMWRHVASAQKSMEFLLCRYERHLQHKFVKLNGYQSPNYNRSCLLINGLLWITQLMTMLKSDAEYCNDNGIRSQVNAGLWRNLEITIMILNRQVLFWPAMLWCICMPQPRIHSYCGYTWAIPRGTRPRHGSGFR